MAGQKPYPHPSNEKFPNYPKNLLPKHIAIVMDGNGRWANMRGLRRTEGHAAGEAALLDVVAGAIEAGVKVLSLYAFSTENWKRSPAEVSFLMGFSRSVLRRQRDLLDSWGVKIRWAGCRKRLWSSVIKELETAQEQTKHNEVLTLVMCVNYGGRAEIAAAAAKVAEQAVAGAISPGDIDEDVVSRYLDEPDLPDVDLFLRTSGEQRISNFMLWQSAYAEFIFLDVLWPDVDRRVLWQAIGEYLGRDRRYGGAFDALKDNVTMKGDDNVAAEG